MMESKSTKGSFLRLLILILMALDQTMLVLATHHDGRHQSRRIHLARVKAATAKFPCNEPQLKAYNLRDLVHGLQPSESITQPMYIVLKRCDSHSGCCISPDLSCTPMPSSIYHEEMEIEVWSLLTNNTKRIWIRVEQHGRCSCEISNASDRLRTDILPPNIEIL